MTFQTPLHLQRRSLVGDRHVVDFAVTRRTTDAFFHVNAVIEISVIGQIVNANPLDRLAGAKTRAHGLEIWTFGPNLLVTAHARVCRRQARGRGSFNRRVAVAAIDTVVADVVFVTELDRLLSFDPLSGVP